MNTTLAQCRYLLSLAKPILDGLDDSHRALEPQPGSKTAGWLIGHLAVSGDFARRLCGRASLCPIDWRTMFNPGSEPSSRSEEHTSELQSQSNLVCRLLLEKKKTRHLCPMTIRPPEV